MAEPARTPSDDPAAAAPAAAGQPTILGKIKIAAFVLIVIGAECLVAYLYLPAAAQTNAMAAAAVGEPVAAEPVAEPAAHGEDDAAPTAEGKLTGETEVDLGEFSVTAYQPASNTTLRIVFHLYGTVEAKNQADFSKRMAESQHRFREQVIVSVRAAEITDLTDAGLGLIKRTILEKTNKLLGKPLLRGIVVSDFSFFEQ